MTYLMSDKGKTAPAAPGLLKSITLVLELNMLTLTNKFYDFSFCHCNDLLTN